MIKSAESNEGMLDDLRDVVCAAVDGARPPDECKVQSVRLQSASEVITRFVECVAAGIVRNGIVVETVLIL